MTHKIPRCCCTSQGRTPPPSIPKPACALPNPLPSVCACIPTHATPTALHPVTTRNGRKRSTHAHHLPRTHNMPGRATSGGGRSRGRCAAAARVSSSSVVSALCSCIAALLCGARAVQTESPPWHGSASSGRRAAAQTYVPWG